MYFFNVGIVFLHLIIFSVQENLKLICNRRQILDTNKDYQACLGVPYAQPPVGDLRFRPPVKVEGFNSSLNYTELKPNCYGMDHKGSENCLFLNIFSPMDLNNSSKPVIVWIPLQNYQNSFMDIETVGPDYFLNEDVVMVVVQFRVGFLGFASNLDYNLPGNWGLKDIRTALIWIQENIQNFGGDKDKVTLMGHGAGASLVSILQLSPSCEGLFSGVIMASGSSLAPSSRAITPKQFYEGVAKGFKLNVTNETSVRQKLRQIEVPKLIDMCHKVRDKQTFRFYPIFGCLLGPVPEIENDHAIFTHKAYDSMSQGNFLKIPTLIGFSSTPAFNHSIEYYGKMVHKMNPEEFCPIPIALKVKNQLKIVGEYVKRFYWSRGLIKTGSPFMPYIVDVAFKLPILKMAELMSQHTKVYMYEFAKIESPIMHGLDSQRFGQELSYLFKNYSLYPEVSSTNSTRQTLVKYYANFAKERDPLPIKDDFSWYPVNFLKNATLYNRVDDKFTLGFNPAYTTIKFFDTLLFNYTNSLDVY